MSTYSKLIREYLNQNSTVMDNLDTVKNMIAKIPIKELIAAVQEATQDIPLYLRGYVIIELMQMSDLDDNVLIDSIQRYLSQPCQDADFGYILLDILFSRASRDQQQAKQILKTLDKVANSEHQPSVLRAMALRPLGGQPAANVLPVLKTFAGSDDPILVNAAAHLIADWQSQDQSVPKEVVSQILKYTSYKKVDALRSPGILRVLTQLKKHSDADAIMTRLISSIHSPDDRAQLLGAVGNDLDIKHLACLMDQTLDEGDDLSEEILASIFTQKSTRLTALYDAKQYPQYLYGLRLVPQKIREAEQERSQKLLEPLGMLPTKEFLELPVAIKRNGAFPVQRSKQMNEIEPEYPIGFHKADAIYTDLLAAEQFFFIQNHWHTCLYAGFRVTKDGSGRLWGRIYGVEATVTTDNNNQRIHYFNVSISPDEDVVSFNSPTASAQAASSALRKRFEDRYETKLQGVRRLPNMNAQLAEWIISTAIGLYGRDIRYTWMDMLRHKWWSKDGWTGNAGQIWETRCDGVIEYCYEKNGQIVCSGKDRRLDNITKEGIRYLDNHNNFHEGFYQKGELCPRIQAGHSDPSDMHVDIPANTTNFIVGEDPSPPKVTQFSISPPLGTSPVKIHFNIKTERYDTVYVRLTVTKDGKTYFVDDTTRWERWAANQHHILEWYGEVGDGTNYLEAGEHGLYEFRLVAIDLGGNVSTLISQTVEIAWCGHGASVPPQIAVESGYLQFKRVYVGKRAIQPLSIINPSTCTDLNIRIEIDGEYFSLSKQHTDRERHDHFDATIAPHRSQVYYVVYQPERALTDYAAKDTATITITHDVPDEQPIILTVAHRPIPQPDPEWIEEIEAHAEWLRQNEVVVAEPGAIDK